MEMCILQVMRGHGFADIFVFRYVIITSKKHCHKNNKIKYCKYDKAGVYYN